MEKSSAPYVTAPLRIPRDVGNSAPKIVTTSSSVSVAQKNPGGALYRRKSEADEAAKPKDCLTQFLVVYNFLDREWELRTFLYHVCKMF
jgi:hypothetical protein